MDNTPNAKPTEKRAPPLTSFLIIAYSPPETFTDEMTEDRARQARKQAERPELRIISRAGEELAADAITITDFQKWGCNDYVLVEGVSSDDPAGLDPENRCYVVLSPRDLVRVRPRDRRDHVAWLLERQRYEEALEEVEKIEADGLLKKTGPVVKLVGEGDQGEGEERDVLNAVEIGQKYIRHLVNEGMRLIGLCTLGDADGLYPAGEFVKAAKLTPKVCGHDPKRWEDWIFAFAEKRQLQVSGSMSVCFRWGL